MYKSFNTKPQFNIIHFQEQKNALTIDQTKVVRVHLRMYGEV